MAAILMYHHIGSPPQDTPKPELYVPRELFAEQVRRLRRWGYRFITLEQLRAGLCGDATLSRKSVALTFDDGYSDQYNLAFPILLEHGAVADFFPITDRIADADEIGQPYMNAQKLRELRAAGCGVGSHTATHTDLTTLDAAGARSELERSRDRLTEALGQPPDWLCYPYGGFNREIADMARDAGYSGACSLIRDNRMHQRQLFWMPRLMVTDQMTPKRLKWVLTRWHRLWHRRTIRKKWGEYL